MSKPGWLILLLQLQLSILKITATKVMLKPGWLALVPSPMVLLNQRNMQKTPFPPQMHFHNLIPFPGTFAVAPLVLHSSYFFFLIGNRTFIEKINIVFMMMNTLDMEKIHKAQELKQTANKLQKAGIEIHCVRPHLRAH